MAARFVRAATKRKRRQTAAAAAAAAPGGGGGGDGDGDGDGTIVVNVLLVENLFLETLALAFSFCTSKVVCGKE